jgi:hypothetical protein
VINEQNNTKNTEKNSQTCENFLIKYNEKQKIIENNTIQDFMSIRHSNISRFRPPNIVKISGLGGPVLGREIVLE